MNADRRLTQARLLLIIIGGVGAGLVLAFAIVGAGHVGTGDIGAGQDARAYWAALRSMPYQLDAGDYAAYLYSPVFLQLLAPLLSMPWHVFMAIWTLAALLTLLALTGPVLFVFALPIAFFEIWGGNIHLLLALAIVLGFRWPWTWSFVLLTKITPGIGLLWFVARREWRSLAIALGATGAIVAVSWLVQPGLWQLWFELLLREAGGTGSGGHIPVPLVVRLPIAALLAVYAGRTDRKWLMPVVVLLAMPILWWGSLTVLIGCVALERDRLEKALLSRLAAIPGWWHERLGGTLAGWPSPGAGRP